jgi:hypothetical protein
MQKKIQNNVICIGFGGFKKLFGSKCRPSVTEIQRSKQKRSLSYFNQQGYKLAIRLSTYPWEHRHMCWSSHRSSRGRSEDSPCPADQETSRWTRYLLTGSDRQEVDWEQSRPVSFLGIHESDLVCSAYTEITKRE